MRKTALDWLVSELPHLEAELLRPILEQAKQMEKDQIEESYAIGYTNCEVGIKYREQYYNETYGKDE